jgi:hypothetical protein
VEAIAKALGGVRTAPALKSDALCAPCVEGCTFGCRHVAQAL